LVQLLSYGPADAHGNHRIAGRWLGLARATARKMIRNRKHDPAAGEPDDE
jgi:hypothetical protein